MKKWTAGKNMSLDKSLSQHFSSILQCVDAKNDYTGLVIATVVIWEYMMRMARFWADSSASDCAAVNPVCHTRHAYSSICNNSVKSFLYCNNNWYTYTLINLEQNDIKIINLLSFFSNKEQIDWVVPVDRNAERRIRRKQGCLSSDHQSWQTVANKR